MVYEVENAVDDLRAFLEWVERSDWEQDLADKYKRGKFTLQRRRWADVLLEEHGDVLLRVAVEFVKAGGVL